MEAQSNKPQFDAGKAPFELPEKVQVSFSAEEMIRRNYNYSHQIAVHDERMKQMCSREELKDAVNNQIKWTVGTMIACTGLAITILSVLIANASDPKEGAPQVIVVQQPVPVRSLDYWENDRK